MQEYYIRKEGDEDSRGPFTLEQLSSLVEAGQVDRQTFYYDTLSEKWVEVQSSPELVASLFPIKKKLSIRPKEVPVTINLKPSEEEEPITVEEMLAAAEGETEETRGKRNLSVAEAKAARLAMRATSGLLLLSAAGMLVSNMDTIFGLDLLQILTTPLILFGVADLLLALFLFLELTSVYALVRLRAALGIGFFLVYFLAAHSQLGDRAWLGIGLTTIGSLAIFALTLMKNMAGAVSFALLGLVGMGGFAYLLLS